MFGGVTKPAAPAQLDELALSSIDRLLELVLELIPGAKAHSLMERVVRAGPAGISVADLVPEGRIRVAVRVWLFEAVRRGELTVHRGRAYLTAAQLRAYEDAQRRERERTQAEARALTRQQHEQRQAIFDGQQAAKRNSEEAQAAAALGVPEHFFQPRRLARATLPAPLFLTTYGDPPTRHVRCSECGRDVVFTPGVRATLRHEHGCAVLSIGGEAAAPPPAQVAR